ncbi:M24 family metallopeptidase [Bowmanella dokdonensis]|uniref:Aminopeptidase P family protein n=1 Tax=Bowmanella dokdonensis TaxID=751969 RepID=A0A939DM88_9ALTE|nr:Xaa-Pro peptidase family protein [Bowmanella dokdonensis]MBN7825232.1 aminopeptidase P family protein [Bowmanella dokdonensis]
MNQYSQRLTRLRQAMTAAGCHAMLISEPTNIRYLSGFGGSSAYLLVTASEQFLITDYRYVQRAGEDCPDYQTYCRDRVSESLGQAVGRLLSHTPNASLYLDYRHLSVELYLTLQSDLPMMELKPAPLLVEDLRAIKEPAERACIERCILIAEQSLDWLLGRIEVGMTEARAAELLNNKMMELGAQGQAFPTILLSGPRSALPHGQPGDRKLCRGDWLLIDFGAQLKGLRCDITRTFVLGKASDEQRRFYQTVARAQQAAIDMVRAGVSGHQINRTASDILAASPYAAYAGEGIGHSFGLSLHEPPLLRRSCETLLQSGMILTIEPGLYRPGFGGVRIEDDILVQDQGSLSLTRFNKDLMEI